MSRYYYEYPDFDTDFNSDFDTDFDANSEWISARIKNQELIEILEDKRDSMCGVGTMRVKRYLNARIKKEDELALAYKLCLDAEDFSIQAKKAIPKYKDAKYAQKEEAIRKLIDVCRKFGYKFGYQHAFKYETSHIIYFYLPGCEQISFHCNLSGLKDLPIYEGEWDGKLNSTLDKLENAIDMEYGEMIRAKYGI